MTFNQLFECSHSSFMLRRGQAIISTGNKRRSIKRKISRRKNLNSNIKSQTIRQADLPIFYWYFVYDFTKSQFFAFISLLCLLVLMAYLASFVVMVPCGTHLNFPLFIMGASCSIYHFFIAKREMGRFISLFVFALTIVGTYCIFAHPVGVEQICLFLILLIFLFLFFPKNWVFFILLFLRSILFPDTHEWVFSLPLEFTCFSFLAFFEKTKESYRVRVTRFVLSFFFFCISFSSDFFNTAPSCIHKILLIIAGACAVYFFILSKSPQGAFVSYILYFIWNVVLGFLLSSNFLYDIPKVTIVFFVFNLLFLIFFLLLSLIRGEPLEKVIGEGKIPFSIFYFLLLKTLLLDFDLGEPWMFPWLEALSFKIGILTFFFFFLKEEGKFLSLSSRKRGRRKILVKSRVRGVGKLEGAPVV